MRPVQSRGLRFICSYFGSFGDPLADPSLDPYPGGLLARLAANGVNGVWLHIVLRQLAWPDPGSTTRQSVEGLLQGLAFAVPGAIGVQEGGFVLLAPLVGVSPETALSLALVKRLRELVIGGGGLLVWGMAPGKVVARQ